MEALLGAATHLMADHSSPDPRARRGADTQRAVYARAQLQVRRGGRTTSSMPCDTNVSKLLLQWASNNYIRCLLPQLLWCMPLNVIFPLPTTSLHLVRPARVVCMVSSMFCSLTRQPVPVTSCVELQSFCPLPMSAMLVFLAQTCEHASAYGLLGGCAHAPLSMWCMRLSTERYTTNAGH